MLLTVAAALAQFVMVCRAHWLDLELAFSGWRKVAAVNRPGRLSQQQQDAQFLQRRNTGAAACVFVCDDDADANAVAGSIIQADVDACSKASVVSAAASMRDGQTSIEAAAAAATGDDLLTQQQEQSELQQALQQQQQQEGDITDEQQQQQQQQERVVHVSLADYPVGMPWRPLELRAGVMAQRGLQRLTGARLAKAVRDLRELEGPYIVKDNKRYVHDAAGFQQCTRLRHITA
jgi:hypothetical protein